MSNVSLSNVKYQTAVLTNISHSTVNPPTVECQSVQCRMSIDSMSTVNLSNIECQPTQCRMSTDSMSNVNLSNVEVNWLTQCRMSICPMSNVNRLNVDFQPVQCRMSTGPISISTFSISNMNLSNVECQPNVKNQYIFYVDCLSILTHVFRPQTSKLQWEETW